MKPIATLVWYYYICKREVWLMSRNLEPDQSNPFIEIGRILSEDSYKYEKKEIKIDNMVLD
ncbi:MAG: CRISPR-associated protein Cas4, partial [Elusimicrobiales bacterium]|nr:CRISPR-associated protein Cas4 [Elusimicrobiales bacterium]